MQRSTDVILHALVNGQVCLSKLGRISGQGQRAASFVEKASCVDKSFSM